MLQHAGSPDGQVHVFADALSRLAVFLPDADPHRVARYLAHLEDLGTGFERSVTLLEKLVHPAGAGGAEPVVAPLDHDHELVEIDLHDLAGRLDRLANQVRQCPVGGLGSALWHVDDMSGRFSDRVDHMLRCAVPPTEAKIAEITAAHQAVDQAILMADQPWDWPAIEQTEFVVTVDFEADGRSQTQLVLRVGDHEIYRRPSWHPGGEHLVKACRALSDAYPGRIKDFDFAPFAHDRLVGDDDRAESRIRKAFKPARKAYTRNNKRSTA